MAWFADLAPCNYFGEGLANSLLAVAWLEDGQPFATGRVSRDVYTKLGILLNEPWQPAVSMGAHKCDMCLYEGVEGYRNLFVPAQRVVFVCPELILHYMNAHAYQPPDEFCQAVLACPEMRSMAYLKALSAASKALIRAAVG